MRWFLNMSTRGKLFVAFSLLLLLLAAVLAAGYSGITGTLKAAELLYNEEYLNSVDLLQLRADLNRQRGNILELTLTTDAAGRASIEEDIKGRRASIDQIMNRLQSRKQSEQAFQAQIDAISVLISPYRDTQDQQVAMLDEGKNAEAQALAVGVQEDRAESMRQIAIELGDQAKASAEASLLDSRERADRSILIFAIIGVIALALSVGMATALTRIIAGPLGRISQVADQVASGNLTATVPFDGRRDEVGLLAQAFGQMIDRQREVTAELREGIAVLASSASEILAASTQVAAGAAETAAAVNQTTTTVAEVRQATVSSSQKAKSVAESAQRSVDVARGGTAAVEDVVRGMQRIQEHMDYIARTIVGLSEQSQAIGEITSFVADLAEQSNLLAVNAAIEAAKAGEQGRGFGVVAQEMRSLAEQSKQATVQVRTLLSEVQKATSATVMATEQGAKAVDAGTAQSGEAGESIRALAASVSEAAQAATHIAASSQEQLVGMDQVAEAMENIKEASSQNVASTKQAESSAHDLHELGHRLKVLVERYQV